MKASMRKKIALMATAVLLIAIGIWDLSTGEISYGIGLIAGVLGVTIIGYRNIKKLERMESQGIDPYDERVMQIAGLAAQGALKLLVLGLALFVGLGAVIGPMKLVNPYNFAGYILAIALLLYVGLFTYHNRRL